MGMYTVVASAREVVGTQSEDFDGDSGSATATVKLIVPAADRYAVVEDVLTNRYEWPHGGTFSPAVVSRVGIVPETNSSVIDNTGDGLTYEEYVLTLVYTTVQPEQGRTQDSPDGTVYSEEISPSTEYLKLDHKDFMWDTDNPLKEGEAPSKILRGFKYSRTLYGILPPLPMALLDMPGCCNAAPFTSPTLGITWPAETLLFGDPQISRERTFSGFSGITIRSDFAYKKDGWNKYWRASSQVFTEIKLKKDGSVYKNYPPVDMTFFLF